MANKTIKIEALETEMPGDKATELTIREMQNVQGGSWRTNPKTGKRYWVDDDGVIPGRSSRY
jgi:bacteriocin-like protein